VLQGLGYRFSCQPLDVPQAVEKVQREGDAARDGQRGLRRRLAKALAAGLLGHGTDPCVAFIEEGDVPLLRNVAQQLCSQPAQVALLAAPQENDWVVVMTRGKASSFDCGGLMKRLVTATGGQGGGRQDRAEGRLPQKGSWPALVKKHLVETE
jgi:alanyl-tRNA synthetase